MNFVALLAGASAYNSQRLLRSLEELTREIEEASHHPAARMYSERIDTMGNGPGCYVYEYTECCVVADGRTWTSYNNQPCVRAKQGTTFTSGNVCEPACWVMGQCGSGRINQSSRSDTCPNTNTSKRTPG